MYPNIPHTSYLDRNCYNLTLKSSDQLEKEKNNSKWETSKVCKITFNEWKHAMEPKCLFAQVREDLCLAHEAYQFFRIKYSKRYGDVNPTPDVFEKVVPQIKA